MLQNYGRDPFVTLMVDTRSVTIIPVTNPIGYFRGERGERQSATAPMALDPNRDFGFAQLASRCLQTVAARAINELFRTHLFRALLTFHGGTNVIGFEWGDTVHCVGRDCNPAPDMKIMEALGRRMSETAGPAGTHEREYPVGDMGGLVYPVAGGMEDWAYGASWSGQGVVCKPNTLGGYPEEKAKIEKGSHRCVTYLVEASRFKKPPEETLGGTKDLMTKGVEEDGHVPRNVRLIMSVVDAVEPYVILNSFKDGKTGWIVGGAFMVDGTVLQWSTKKGDEKTSGMSTIKNGTIGLMRGGGSGVEFEEQIPDDVMKEGMLLRVVAVVDQIFSTQPNDSVPNTSPQSHLMGARASRTWDFSVGEHNIVGKDIFCSDTFKIVKKNDSGWALEKQEAIDWGTGEEDDAWSSDDAELFTLLTGGRRTSSVVVAGRGMGGALALVTAVGGVVIIVAIAVCIFMFARKRRKAGRRSRAKNSFVLMEDDEEEEERQALTPITGNGGISEEEMRQVMVDDFKEGSTID